jgi:hypothetical protein
MGRAEEYRRYARQCLEIAPTFQDEEARATLLDLARAWLRLVHLAQANRHIADLAVQIVRQRSIVKHARDTGQRLDMAESLLAALEGSLRIFEKHRIFLLQLQRQRAQGQRFSAHRSLVKFDAGVAWPTNPILTIPSTGATARNKCALSLIRSAIKRLGTQSYGS